MTGRVEEHDPGLAWLRFGSGGAEFDAAIGCCLDVVGGEVEVELLVTVVGPARSLIVRE